MKNNRFMLACALLLALSACSTMKKELGVGRNSPDEFMVVKRAPLSLPPDYSLRPPSDSDVAPASDASDHAKALLIGEGGEEQPATSGSSETALLQEMGADKSDPEIRSVINRENGYIAVKNEKLVDKLIFWKDEQEGVSDDDLDTSVVNPTQEAERLKKNQEEGKPVNEGKVPTIEKKKGVVDRLF